MLEYLVLEPRVVGGSRYLLRRRLPRVHAVEPDRAQQPVEIVGRAAVSLGQEGRAVPAVRIVGNWYHGLPGEVSTHDQRVDLVEPPGAHELTPADVGSVHVGRVYSENDALADFWRRHITRRDLANT